MTTLQLKFQLWPALNPVFELSLKLCDEKLSYKQSLLSATGTALLNYSAGLLTHSPLNRP